MRVADLSPDALRVACAAAGLVGGLGAAALADRLPARSGVSARHLARGPARTRRNAAVVVLSIAIGLGLSVVILRFPDASVERVGFYLAVNLGLSAAFLAAAAIDLEHMILPNEITVGGAVLALATAHFRNVGLVGALAGGVVGLAASYLPALLYRRLRPHAGMGLGDAKLAITAGTWLGPWGALFVLAAGALQQVACALILRALGLHYAVPASVTAEIDDLRRRAAEGDAEAKAELADDPVAAEATGNLGGMKVPFGPFLAMAALEFLFAGDAILAAFFRFGAR